MMMIMMVSVIGLNMFWMKKMLVRVMMVVVSISSICRLGENVWFGVGLWVVEEVMWLV